MRNHEDAVLLETSLEERDGGRWLTGRCSRCWERVGFRDVSDEETVLRCKNEHALRVVERRCAGACTLCSSCS
jgi:hypothetical protein